MERLCFGTFANIMKDHIKDHPSQTKVTELLLGLITDNEDITNQYGEPYVVKASIASDLLKCKVNLPKNIRNGSVSLKILEAASDYFKDVVIPEIPSDLTYDLLSKFRNLISFDRDIPQEKRTHFLVLAHEDTLSDFLADVFLYALKKPNRPSEDHFPSDASNTANILEDVANLQNLLKRLQSKYPAPLTPPDEIEDDELIYAKELLIAYADAKGLDELLQESLSQYPQFKNDFERRRKDYYCAEALRRGSRDVFGETGPAQFDVLKDETYDGVIDVYSSDFPHGLARLNSVMAQAALIPVDKCLFGHLPNWIGASEKKGVCHMLVNEGRMKGWVASD